MFGGTGIYRDGLIFALSIDDGVYLKSDPETVDTFKQAGSKPFSYLRKDGRRTDTSYYSLPDEALDDPEQLAALADLAFAAARRAEARKG